MNGPPEAGFPHEARGVRASVLVIAALGVVRVYAATAGLGPGVATDSVAYLSSADAFFEKGAFIMHDGTPLVRWPPGFPLALAGMRLLSLSALEGSRHLNAWLFGLTIGVAGLVVVKHAAHAWLGALAAAALVLSIPLAYAATVVWSETLFTFIAVGLTVLLARAARNGTVADAAAAGVALAAAILTRYVGLGLLLGSGALLLATSLRLRRAGALIVLGVTAAIPALAWFARNSMLAGTTRGGWAEPAVPPGEVLPRALDTIAMSVLPPHIPMWIRISAIAGLILTLAVLAIREGLAAPGTEQKAVTLRVTLITLLGGYCVFWVGCAYFVMIDLDGRMFAPMFPLAIMLLVLRMDGVLTWMREKGMGRWVAGVVVAAAAGLLLFPAWHSYHSLRYSAMTGGGGGFNTRAWRESSLLRGVKDLPTDARIISNAPGAIYLWSRRFALGFGARYYPPTGDGGAAGLRELSEAVHRYPDIHVAVFDSSLVEFSYAYGPQELATAVGTRLHRRYSDGSLYEVADARARPIGPPRAGFDQRLLRADVP